MSESLEGMGMPLYTLIDFGKVSDVQWNEAEGELTFEYVGDVGTHRVGGAMAGLFKQSFEDAEIPIESV